MYNDDYLKQVLGDDYNNSNVLANSTYEPDYTSNVYPREMYKQNSEPEDDDNTSRVESSQEVVRNNNEEQIENNDERKVDSKDKKENVIEKGVEKIKDIMSNVANDFDRYYPEIYRMIEPMIEALIAKNANLSFSGELIETMAREIYDAIEKDIDPSIRQVNAENNSKENEARPVNANAIEVSKRPRNSLLFDLIKILILNQFRENKPRPPMNRPENNQKPNNENRPNQNQPPRPPEHRPNNPPINNRPNEKPMTPPTRLTYNQIPFPEDVE